MDERELAEAVMRVSLACTGLSTREQLDVLQLAWSVVASTARTEALIEPGAHPEERARQVVQLLELAVCVGADEPDLEMERIALDIERLSREGDIAGMVRRLDDQRRHAEARLREARGEPETDAGEKGGA
jgi:hypothetical protein